MSGFYAEASAGTAAEAFAQVADQYNKTEYIEFPVGPGQQPRNVLREAEGDDRIQDPTGPCGCVQLKSDCWAFFGQTDVES